MADTDYESLVGLLISRWVSRKLLPCYESVPRRSRALQRSGQPKDERLRETERTRGWRMVVKWAIGEKGKSKARYSTENNIRADDDDRI